MRKLIYLIPIFIGIISCEEQKPENTEWQFEKTIALDGINPIGLAVDGDAIYLSDGDHNRVVKIDSTGNIIQEIADFERPMHIDAQFGTNRTSIYVPEYGRDSIAVMRDGKREYLALPDSLDAPAGVSIYNDEIAIADFYNNRVLYYNGKDWTSFGKEGKALGDFYYPTDVQITEDKIYVADAYNNRGQVFDKSGKVLSAFGEADGFNAATGIYISDQEIFLTDFENSRVLVYDMDYNLKQVLENGIDKPTDMAVVKNQLLVTNYRKGELVVYELRTKDSE